MTESWFAVRCILLTNINGFVDATGARTPTRSASPCGRRRSTVDVLSRDAILTDDEGKLPS